MTRYHYHRGTSEDLQERANALKARRMGTKALVGKEHHSKIDRMSHEQLDAYHKSSFGKLDKALHSRPKDLLGKVLAKKK